MIFKTALHIACENGNVEIVKLLLSKPSIDVNCFLEISKLIYNVFSFYYEILFLYI